MIRLLLIVALLLYPLAARAGESAATARPNGAVGFVQADGQQLYFSDVLRGKFIFETVVLYPPDFGTARYVYFDNVISARKAVTATSSPAGHKVEYILWRELLAVATQWPLPPWPSPAPGDEMDGPVNNSVKSIPVEAGQAYDKGLKNCGRRHKICGNGFPFFELAAKLAIDNAYFWYQAGVAAEDAKAIPQAIISFQNVLKYSTDPRQVDDALRELHRIGA